MPRTQWAQILRGHATWRAGLGVRETWVQTLNLSSILTTSCILRCSLLCDPQQISFPVSASSNNLDFMLEVGCNMHWWWKFPYQEFPDWQTGWSLRRWRISISRGVNSTVLFLTHTCYLSMAHSQTWGVNKIHQHVGWYWHLQPCSSYWAKVIKNVHPCS